MLFDGEAMSVAMVVCCEVTVQMNCTEGCGKAEAKE